jgi:hypothetical protein
MDIDSGVSSQIKPGYHSANEIKSQRMFEKYRKSLRCAAYPPVIANHGLAVQSLLKQTEDPGSAGF